MKIILFGATGMIGQGVLRECLLDPDVEEVLSISRASTGQTHAKLREILHKDLTDLSSIEGQLAGYDACLFTLGISSAGISEADYTRITYDITMAVAEALLRKSPDIAFLFISGAGTDSTEKGGQMWARVKGKTENALLRMPFKAAHMFRPGIIQPKHGITSRTSLYRVLYVILWPLFPLVRALFPKHITTTESLGQAMLAVAKRGAPKKVLESPDINAVLAPAA